MLKKKVLINLHNHLRRKEIVCCPFEGCSFETNNLNSFTGHTSRNHKDHNLREFLTTVRVLSDFQSNNTEQACSENPGTGVSLPRKTEKQEPDCVNNVDSEILEHRLANLFLHMQCLLHVPKHAIQTIIDEFN